MRKFIKGNYLQVSLNRSKHKMCTTKPVEFLFKTTILSSYCKYQLKMQPRTANTENKAQI